MSKKPKEEGQIVYRKFGESITFVLNNLDEGDAAKLADSPLDSDVLFQMHDKAHEIGFTCTTKFDAYSKAWQATVICNAISAPNVGLAVSGRSTAGVSDAMFVAYFKLFHVAGGDLTKFVNASPGRGKRG